MNNLTALFCHVCETSNNLSYNEIITAVISVLSLFLNILFYIIIAPKIGFKIQKKEKVFEVASEFLMYLSEIVSFTDFNGVPTNVRKYCLSIHLTFKSGEAPTKLSKCLEDIFQMTKSRKNLTDKSEIDTWEIDFRQKTHELRVLLAKYTGVLK